MNAAPWRIRPYRPGDEKALVTLWTEAFGRSMTEAHWRWKVKGRPTPVENVGVAVAADDRPIFQFVGIPCPAVVLGAPRIVMVGVDVVTAPAFRRRGVFTETARRLLENWREAGVALVLGLGNSSGASLAQAPGCDQVFSLRRLIRPLRPERVLARRARLPVLARLRGLGRLWNGVWDRLAPAVPGIALRPLASATPDIDIVWERAVARVQTSLVRDRAWVRWRYCESPNGPYRLTLAERAGIPVGYAVHRVVRNQGRTVVQVPEVFAPADARALRALVRSVVAAAAAEDAETVVTLAIPGSSAEREFRRAGFFLGPGSWPVEVTRLDPAIPAAALRDPSGWWLMGGDFDVM
jgi:GNAT superfamily N-acetyltransferase